jgi:hypothetical protein
VAGATDDEVCTVRGSVRLVRCGVALVLIALAAAPLRAQPPDEDPDLDLNLSQPDFTLAALPTNLRLARGKFAFRVSHRFARPLGDGDIGSLVEDFFGLDSGAQIGLELRYGLFRGLQVGVHRTSERSVQLFTQVEVASQRSFPLGIGLWASTEGTNNFRDRYSPAVGLVVSRELGERGALYAEPIWIGNHRPGIGTADDGRQLVFIGLGSRLRVGRAVYLTAEVSPRLSRDVDGHPLVSFGVERRAGGHTFALNLSNGFGTTVAQIARGGSVRNDWYLGFNISRKFY